MLFCYPIGLFSLHKSILPFHCISSKFCPYIKRTKLTRWKMKNSSWVQVQDKKQYTKRSTKGRPHKAPSDKRLIWPQTHIPRLHGRPLNSASRSRNPGGGRRETRRSPSLLMFTQTDVSNKTISAKPDMHPLILANHLFG